SVTETINVASTVTASLSGKSDMSASSVEDYHANHLKQVVSNGLSAMAITVSGVVKGDNGEVLPGVNVVEKGTVNGLSTDVDGKY
ncbi:carboxypeptidase-like regulatory domain-containing protein, partial [Microbacterium sp. ZXX196]|uniref:carboxypeptidase-like regulatory domain-containing protein n=1 Tax=Microbacterium sp. ZXX196 TaxID=2609291 RepID=UPI001E63515D